MQIHIAYQNVDTVLELIPTHQTQKRYNITPQGEPAAHQRLIRFDSELSDEKLLQEENLAQKLKDTDIEVDMELAGNWLLDHPSIE